MKSLRHLAITAAAACIAASNLHAATVVGTGADTSYLVIEAGDFGAPLIYEFHYDFDSLAPIDTYDMLVAVDLADENISFDFINYGSEASPNFLLNTITYNLVALTNTGAPDYEPFWYQSVSGGKAGFLSLDPVPSGEWSEGSGISYPYRELEPGSSDGFVYGSFGDLPTVAPVPEPGTIALFALGGFALLCYRRKRHA